MIKLFHPSSHDCPHSRVCTHPLAHVLFRIFSHSQCTDCTNIDRGYTTLGLGALASDQCVCKSGYFLNYVNATYVGGVLKYVERFCDDCDGPGRIGYDCRSPGNALESLRMEVGYTRSHNLSTRVRQCFHKAFCTPPNATNSTNLALVNVESNLGVCAQNHAGPYCEVCVKGYIMSVEGCVACTGSRALSYIFPVLFLVFGLGLGIYLCRSGRAKALAKFAESVLTGAEQRDVSSIEAGIQQYCNDGLIDANARLHRELSTEHEEAARAGSDAATCDAEASTSAYSKPGTPPSASPPTSPPSAGEASQSACQSASTGRRPTSLVRQKSIRVWSNAAAVRRGCTSKRIASAQIKFRIIVSLIQVIGQLGIVFSIPYPDLYSDLISILGVFSLDLLEIMPLKCSFALNHDHFLLIRTLLPLAIALVILVARHCLRTCATRKRKAARDNAGEAEMLGMRAKANEALADQLLTFIFVIFYLIYPSNSANIFATFQCETLDDPEQSSFLRKDFKVDCKTSFHQYMMYYAALMVFVYPLGIPCLYTYLLFFKHGAEVQLLKSLELERCALKDEQIAASNLRLARDIHGKPQASWRGGRRRSESNWKSRAKNEILQSCRSLFSTSQRTVVVNQADESLKMQMCALQCEEDAVREELPDYVQKLILGYELRTYYFEILECFRKLAIVCLPVFFQPSGSVSQLIFGLIVCFLTFGTLMVYAPYVEEADDRLAQLCQVQIFFALLSSIAFKYDTGTMSNAVNMDILLTTLTIIPCALAFLLETPLADIVTSRKKGQALGNVHSFSKKAKSALYLEAPIKRSHSTSSSSVAEPKPNEAVVPESEICGPSTTIAPEPEICSSRPIVAPEPEIHRSLPMETPGTQEQATPPDLEGPLAADGTRLAEVDLGMEASSSQALLATFGEGPVGITITHRHGAVRVVEVDVGSQAEAQGVRIGASVDKVAGQSTCSLDVEGVLKLMSASSRPFVVEFGLAHDLNSVLCCMPEVSAVKLRKQELRQEEALETAMAETEREKRLAPSVRAPAGYDAKLVELNKSDVKTWLGLTLTNYKGGGPYPVITSMKKFGAAAKESGLKKGTCAPQHLTLVPSISTTHFEHVLCDVD